MFIRGTLILYQFILKLAFNVFIKCFDPVIFVIVSFMLIDVIIGIFGAIAGKSSKSKSGTFEKEILQIGLLKKLIAVFFIVIAAWLDILFGAKHYKNSFCFFLCALELKSIIKNAEAMGVQCSSFFKSIVTTLENLSEKRTDTYSKKNKK